VKVRTQLLLAGAPLAVALVIVGVFAVRSISLLDRAAQSILAQNYRSVLAAQRMKEMLERIDDDSYFIATGHPEQADVRVDGRRGFEKELRVEEGNITEPGEGEVTAELRRGWDDYQERLDACAPLPPGPEAQACYFRDLRPRFHALHAAADHVLAINQDAMALKGERTRQQAQRVDAAMIAAVLAALVAGLLLSAWLASRALRPLAALGQSVEQFGHGDFAVRAPVRGGAELAQLARTFNAMADRITEFQRSSLGEMLQAQLAAQSTLDSLTDPVFVFAPSGEISSLNRAAEELFPAGEGRFEATRLDPPIRDAVEAVRLHVLQGKGTFVPRSFDEAFTAMRPDGERAYLPRASPVYDEGGGIVAATVVLQDVTRLHRFEQLRDDLVSTVAHQFRTPLTSLRMAIHLCLDGVAGPLETKQQDLLYAAREECERLQAIVDELLDLARLQSGTIPLDREEERVDRLVERIVREFTSAAHAGGIELVAEPVAAEETVRVDRQRIELVFSNLIENALRHTPSGGRVMVRAVEQGGAVRFEVIDSGPGIAESERGRVFEKFYRAPGSTGGGAGLGLSIARDVVRAHGGRIGVESEPGHGSTFWFTIPQADDLVPAGGPAAPTRLD
jgi:two-component system, NtrC family, sensor histidine kinase KinB